MFTLLLSGCQWQDKPQDALERIRESGVLRVGTLNNQLSYYIGADGPTGLDYELAQRFAKELGKTGNANHVYPIRFIPCT